MTYGIRQGARCYAWRLALIGLVIGLQWAGIGFNLWHDYRFAEQKAGNDAANYARAFDENINRTVEAVDQTLLFLRDGYQRDPAGFAGASWATGRVFLDNLRVQLAVANREASCSGRILVRSRRTSPSPIEHIFRSSKPALLMISISA